MKRYKGLRIDQDTVVVTVEVRDERAEEYGPATPLPLRLELENKSPTGFEWGYRGSGPAQLALAIVCDALGVPPDTKPPEIWTEPVPSEIPVRRALATYQGFKETHVARWGREWWILDDDVIRCVERVERGGR